MATFQGLQSLQIMLLCHLCCCLFCHTFQAFAYECLAMLHIAYSTIVRVERLYLCFYYVPHCCAMLKIYFQATTNAQRTSCCIALVLCMRTLVTNTKIVAVKQRQVKIEFRKCLEDNRRTMKFDLKTKLVPLGNRSFRFCDVNQKPPQVGSTIHSIRKFDMLELENLVSFVKFFFSLSLHFYFGSNIQAYINHVTNLPKKKQKHYHKIGNNFLCNIFSPLLIFFRSILMVLLFSILLCPG